MPKRHIKLTDARLVRLYDSDDKRIAKLMKWLDAWLGGKPIEKQEIIRKAVHAGLPVLEKRIKK